jgi:hypothetical protein
MHLCVQGRPAASLVAALALAGCGGVANDIANDISQPLADVYTCALRNCTESSTLNTDEISPRFTATQSDGERTILIEGFLGKSANLLTTVMPASNERLSASADGGTEVVMANPDGQRFHYSASPSSANAQPVVRVIFTRGGVRHVSEVTLPSAFTVLQPTGSPALTRSGGDLAVRLSLATQNTAGATADGSCTRTDGSSFKPEGVDLGAIAETSVAGGYRLSAASIDDALNASSRNANNGVVTTPLVARCQLTVVWTRTAFGTVAPTLNSHGSLVGVRQVTHPLSYDAQR